MQVQYNCSQNIVHASLGQLHSLWVRVPLLRRFENLTCSYQVEVCGLEEMTTQACHFDPSLPDPTNCVRLNALKQVQCTDEYQRARLQTTVLRTDGMQVRRRPQA